MYLAETSVANKFGRQLGTLEQQVGHVDKLVRKSGSSSVQ